MLEQLINLLAGLMKNSHLAFFILLFTSLIFISMACQPQSNEHKDTNESYFTDSIPLIYHMSFMQRYSTKLYFSGIEQNWALADIYAHEIEELTETIIKGKHVDDGVEVSELLENMLPPQIEHIEEAIDAKDVALFEQNYEAMIQTCNKCHQAANYGPVKITVPETNPFAQDFSVVQLD